MWQGSEREIERSPEHQLYHVLELLAREAFHRSNLNVAHVIDEDIEAAEVLDHAIYKRARLRFFSISTTNGLAGTLPLARFRREHMRPGGTFISETQRPALSPARAIRR